MKTQLNNNYNLAFKNNTELFYQWLTGFIDGEESFQINLYKDSLV
jgi:hypothetical protein